MKKTTMNMTNAIQKSIKSTCDPHEIIRRNYIFCKGDDNGINDNLFRLDGMPSKNPRVSDFEKATIIALKKMGYTDLKVALETCRSLGTIYKVKKEANMVRSRGSNPHSQEQLMRDMRKFGLKVKEISSLLGVSEFTVYRYTRGLNRKYNSRRKVSL